MNILKKKIIIAIILTAIVVVTAGVVIFLKVNNGEKTIQTFGATQKNLNAEEEIIVEVKEEVINVAVDNSPEESLIEKKEEKVVKYKDKEIKIPKRKVAAAKDVEDGQKQKTGGEAATVSSFENDGQYVGIDVSSWQGNINWKEVANSGVQFAMIRVGFRGYAEEGNIKEDAYFRQNINGAVSNGIKVGIYFYSTARNEAEAVQEAAWTIDKIKSYAITYPVAYDFEEFGVHRTAGISGDQATNNAIAFLNYVSSQGFGTMIYANKNDITNNFKKSRLPYKFWLAHYTSSTDYTGSYQMWQRTSKGSVPGINGNVDMNIAYFGYGSVAKPKHTHDFAGGEEIKNKSLAATCEKAGYKMMRCKECSESEKVTVPAIGHKWSKWEVKEKATEEKEGLEVRTCSNCKKEETKVIEKLKPNENVEHTHTFEKDETLSEAATCGKDGKEVKKCIECGKTEETTVRKTENHNWKSEITKESTCKEEGTQVETCTICGETKENTLQKTEEHNWGEWKTTLEPTCKEGIKVKICTVCGKESKEKIPPTKEHKFENYTPVQGNSNKEQGTCSCGETDIRDIRN